MNLEQAIKSIKTQNLLTLGGVIGVAIIANYGMNAYLNYLRIQKLKKELSEDENNNFNGYFPEHVKDSRYIYLPTTEFLPGTMPFNYSTI